MQRVLKQGTCVHEKWQEASVAGEGVIQWGFTMRDSQKSNRPDCAVLSIRSLAFTLNRQAKAETTKEHDLTSF